MKTNRRLRSRLAARTWFSVIMLALLGIGETWMLNHAAKDWCQLHAPPVAQRDLFSSQTTQVPGL